MRNLYPKMMWTISNFVLNTNDANPVFKDMLRQFTEIISSIHHPNIEDANFILQTLYFFDKMVQKNLLSKSHKNEEILPTNTIQKLLRIKRESLENDTDHQRDMKIVV